jgi:hypothetical protein
MFGPHQVPLPSSSSEAERTVFVYRAYPHPYGDVVLKTEQASLTAKELADILYRGIALVYHCAPVKVFNRQGEEYSPTEIVYENNRLLEDVFVIHYV